jgi:hypothetical protein
MKYAVWARGPADTCYHIIALLNTQAAAEECMAEFLSDRPEFTAEVRPY